MNFIPKELIERVLESYLSKVTTRSRLIYGVSTLILIMGIISLPLIYVDVAVQARGFFQSEIERQAIYAPINGKVLYTAINTGREVFQGDTLLIIDSETIKAEMAAVDQKRYESNASLNDLREFSAIKLIDERLSTILFIDAII